MSQLLRSNCSPMHKYMQLRRSGFVSQSLLQSSHARKPVCSPSWPWLIVPAFQRNKRHLPKQHAPADFISCVMMRSSNFQFSVPFPAIALVYCSFNGSALSILLHLHQIHHTNSSGKQTPCATRTGTSSYTRRAVKCRSRNSRPPAMPCRRKVAEERRAGTVCLVQPVAL